MTRYGFGKHIGTVTSFSARSMFLKVGFLPSNLARKYDPPCLTTTILFHQLDFVTMLTYVLALGAIKISFCVLYLQIFPGRKFRIACWCLLAILIGETVAETFVVIFQCIPVHKAWDATGLVEGYCVNMTALYYSNFAIKLATDLAIFIMPIPKLWQLKMTRGKRMGLVVMFSLGLLYVPLRCFWAMFPGIDASN